MRWRVVFLWVGLLVGLTYANSPSLAADQHFAYPLQKITVHLDDTAALQRGAKIFMNYCSGCHSLKYMRYDRMAKDIDITTSEGKVEETLLRTNLIFDHQAKVSDPMIAAMSPDDAKAWFGLSAPDLSLVIRSRGANWVYTYLKSFYKDEHRTNWGVNNLVFENVAMPNVFEHLQGVQVLVQGVAGKDVDLDGDSQDSQDSEGSKNRQDRQDKQGNRTGGMGMGAGDGNSGASGNNANPVHLARLTPGELSPAEFDQTVSDLITFLAYVAEPTQTQRLRLGWWVLAFLLIFAVSAYFLKREYWKDIK